jgi:hypothetical protein
MDELFEVLTLIQTQRTKPSPVVLIDVEFWKPMVDWVTKTLLRERRTVSAEDLGLFFLTDDLAEAVNHMKVHAVEAGPVWEHLPRTAGVRRSPR